MQGTKWHNLEKGLYNYIVYKCMDTCINFEKKILVTIWTDMLKSSRVLFWLLSELTWFGKERGGQERDNCVARRMTFGKIRVLLRCKESNGD